MPFAAIVGLYPNHPSVQSAVDFLKNKESPDGMIVSDGIISTEGCYTLAYPLAAIAAHRKNKDLAQVALNQLKFRMQYLANESDIFQRSSLDGAKSFKNWGRGIAWYLLGTIKTLEVLKHFRNDLTGWPEIEHEFQRAVGEVCMHQNREGMWYSFIVKVETGVDTSATAGIASALAWGVWAKSLDELYLKKAKSAHESIKQYLTPDGFLKQITQIIVEEKIYRQRAIG